jgi:hypothetical protein
MHDGIAANQVIGNKPFHLHSLFGNGNDFVEILRTERPTKPQEGRRSLPQGAPQRPLSRWEVWVLDADDQVSERVDSAQGRLGGGNGEGGSRRGEKPR